MEKGKRIWQVVVVIILSSILVFSIFAEPVKTEIDLDKDLKAIERELRKIEKKVKKQEEEEKQINVAKEMDKVERLMREIYKEFSLIGGGKKGEEIIARLKRIEEKLQDIISHISLAIHPVVKKENDTIEILEKIIKNWVFEVSISSNSKQKKKDQQYSMSPEQLKKLLSQLKKEREKERRKRQQGRPQPNQPATSAYDVPPSNPETGEVKEKGSEKGISWGNLPEKIREALEEVEINEIPDDIKEIYKEFKKALGKGEAQ